MALPPTGGRWCAAAMLLPVPPLLLESLLPANFLPLPPSPPRRLFPCFKTQTNDVLIAAVPLCLHRCKLLHQPHAPTCPKPTTSQQDTETDDILIAAVAAVCAALSVLAGQRFGLDLSVSAGSSLQCLGWRWPGSALAGSCRACSRWSCSILLNVVLLPPPYRPASLSSLSSWSRFRRSRAEVGCNTGACTCRVLSPSPSAAQHPPMLAVPLAVISCRAGALTSPWASISCRAGARTTPYNPMHLTSPDHLHCLQTLAPWP